MQNELVREGFALMLAGMGTVFVFLTVLVIAMTMMSRELAPNSLNLDSFGSLDYQDDDIRTNFILLGGTTDPTLR